MNSVAVYLILFFFLVSESSLLDSHFCVSVSWFLFFFFFFFLVHHPPYPIPTPIANVVSIYLFHPFVFLASFFFLFPSFIVVDILTLPCGIVVHRPCLAFSPLFRFFLVFFPLGYSFLLSVVVAVVIVAVVVVVAFAYIFSFSYIFVFSFSPFDIFLFLFSFFFSLSCRNEMTPQR